MSKRFSFRLFLLLRDEGLTRIEVGKLGASNQQNHIGKFLASRCDKAQGRRRQLVLGSRKLRTRIDACMSRIAALDFNDVDMPMQIVNFRSGLQWHRWKHALLQSLSERFFPRRGLQWGTFSQKSVSLETNLR